MQTETIQSVLLVEEQNSACGERMPKLHLLEQEKEKSCSPFGFSSPLTSSDSSSFKLFGWFDNNCSAGGLSLALEE